MSQNVRANLAAFVAGLIFVLGLGVSGMTDPNKVLAFLNPGSLGGRFDASLMAVMGAAVAVAFVGYRLVLRRERPVLSARFHLPRQTRLDPRLVLGAVLFGVGWGLSGYCPGPALASLVTGAPSALVFVAAMFVGMGVHARFQAATAVEQEPASDPEPHLESTPAE